jgi:uncharacterized membrane protein
MGKTTRAVTITAIIAMAALLGCRKSEGSDAGGNGRVRVVVPEEATNVKQGDNQTITVSIDRGSALKETIQIDVQYPPSRGITVVPSTKVVLPSENGEVQLKITATAEAPVGISTILVTVTPEKGEAVQAELKVNVTLK